MKIRKKDTIDMLRRTENSDVLTMCWSKISVCKQKAYNYFDNSNNLSIEILYNNGEKTYTVDTVICGRRDGQLADKCPLRTKSQELIAL